MPARSGLSDGTATKGMGAMLRRHFLLSLGVGLLALGCTDLQHQMITSPNGRVSVSFDVEDGRAHYAIRYDGTPVIDSSGLGMRTRGGSLRDGLVAKEVSIDSRELTWEPVWGIRSPIEDRHVELLVTLKEPGADGRTLTLRFRAYDDGAAFRYEIPAQEGLARIEVTGEETEIRFPADQKAFVLSRTGFEDSYEGTFDPVRLSEVSPETLIGMPLLVEGDGHEIGELHLDHRPQADQRGSDTAANDRRLGEGSIEAAILAEALGQGLARGRATIRAIAPTTLNRCTLSSLPM